MDGETIHIENLSIGYPGKNDVKVVADGICAGVNSGELTCLLGADGVGKSTLLRTLSAFQPKLGGEIHIQGREVETCTDKQLSYAISIMLTEKCDLRNMSVTELAGLGHTLYTGLWGILTQEDKHVVEHSIALVDIPHLAHHMVHTLSDGERQKVMIAKALAQETPVIYLDKPTAFLDFPSKVEVVQLPYHLSKRTDKTIFLSTHDLELVLQIAGKIWLMDKTNGIIIGTPEDLSLNGSLGSFFAHKDTVFDPESELFRVDSKYVSQVRLSSSGRRYAMMRRALQRNGIFAGHNVETETHVETDGCTEGGDEVFVVHQPGRESVCLSGIREVLAKLLPELMPYGKERDKILRQVALKLFRLDYLSQLLVGFHQSYLCFCTDNEPVAFKRYFNNDTAVQPSVPHFILQYTAECTCPEVIIAIVTAVGVILFDVVGCLSAYTASGVRTQAQ